MEKKVFFASANVLVVVVAIICIFFSEQKTGKKNE